MAELLVVMLATVGGFSTHAPRPPAPAARPRCATTEGRWRRHATSRRRKKRCVLPAARPRPVAPRPAAPAGATAESLAAPVVPAAPEAAPSSAAAPPDTAPAETAPPPPPPPPPPVPLPHRLQVDEGEYYVRPSRRRVAAGRVEMNITNFGEDDHDLAVEASGIVFAHVDLRPRQTRQVFVELPAGGYKLYCTLQNGAHDAAGMHATLTAE